MALSSGQQRLLAQVYKTPAWKRASPKERKALVEAGLVESNLTNVAHGDRDSEGFLQQRPSQGWKNVRHVPTAATSFLDRAKNANTKGTSAGTLAQAVQRSAYPGRYDERSADAEAALGTQAPAAAQGAKSAPKLAAVDSGADRRSAILNYVQNSHDPSALIGLASALRRPRVAETPPAGEESTTPAAPSAAPKAPGGIADFEGKQVAAWIKPLLEYAREKGWKGSVTSGYRSDADQARIYRSGVRPAAKPQSMGGGGSNHSRTGFLQGAIDVSDAEGLDRILKAKHSRLKFAGAKDPVHFSVPRNGSY